MPVLGFREREAEVQINDGLGNIRRWTAIADPSLNTPTFDYAPGSSVVVTIFEAKIGTAPPLDPDGVYIFFYDEGGTEIRGHLFPNPVNGEAFTFWFTHDGTATGTPSASTVELLIRAHRGSGTGPGEYNVESDGSPELVPPSFEARLHRGYMRNITTAAVSTTNQGGTKPALFAFDDTINHRLTWGHRRYRASTFTVAVSGATPALSATTPSTAGPVWDTTFANVVDERFPASQTTQSATWTVPNSFAGLPLVTLTSNTTDSLTIDPRLTAAHHFQVDDNTFAVAKHDVSLSMLNTESGFLWTRIRNARSEGVNGLTVVQTLVPVKAGDTFTATATTTTQDGQAGVGGRLDWTASKPGGIWNKTSDVTAPSDIDADTHLVGATAQHVLLAPDPNIKAYTSLTVAEEANHAHPGDPLILALTVETKKTRTRIAVDAGTAVCSLVRYNQSLDRWEFLDSDGVTWVEWTTTGVRAEHTLVETPPGSLSYERQFDTTSWGNTDVVSAAAHFEVNGTPYESDEPRELTGRAHAHSHTGGALVTAQATIS